MNHSLSLKRVVVTGAAGFIGLHVAEALLDRGVEVMGVDALVPYYDPALKQARLARLLGRNGFSFEQIDVADYDAVDAAIGAFRPDAIVHLAAQAGVRYSLENPRAYASANLDGFLSVLEASRRHGVGHLVYASSSSVYGANAKVPFSEHDGADHPISLYAATKRANELMAHSYAHLYGIPMTGLRFFTVYGPWGRPDMAYFKFTKAILAGEPIDVYAVAQMSRDFTYVDDICEAIVRLAARPAAPDSAFDSKRPDPATAAAPWRIYNIGNHTPVALSHFIDVVEAACGRKAIRRHLPAQPGDVPTTYADVADLAAAVDFRPDTSAAPWRIYNIGNHTPVALSHFIDVVEAACGRKAIRRHLPAQPGDVLTTYADLAAAVDFRPDTSIEAGIPRFVAWFREFYRV